MRNAAQREQSDAHLRALDHLDRMPGFGVFNLGSGQDWSVAEVLAACRAQCDGKPAADSVGRRSGDPPVLVATHAAATASVDWRPRLALEECLRMAMRWHKNSQ